MGGFLSAVLGVRVWGGQEDLCPTPSLSATVPPPHPSHCVHDISWGYSFLFSRNHVFSCLICPQELLLVCPTSLLFSLPWASSDWAVTLCVRAGGARFSTAPFLPRPSPAALNTLPSNVASKALRNLWESLLLPAREAETSEKSNSCLTKLLVAPC